MTLTDGGKPLDLAIENHRVVGVPYRPDNMGPVIAASLLVLHYTGTRKGEATVKALEHPKMTASVQLVLHRDGAWTQMVPFNRRAGHAGASIWQGRPGCNSYSIGIEIVNPGPLEDDGKTLVIERSRETGKLYPWAKPWDGEVVEARHKNKACRYKYWCAYTTAQMVALAPMTRLLVETYGLTIVGHEDIAPSRKIDPGPAFPWDEFRLAVYGPTKEALEPEPPIHA